MRNLVILLMLPSFLDHSSDSSSFSSLIMMLVIFTIPLSWVIPYIVRKNRKKQPHQKPNHSSAKTQIELLKDLADLKEKGMLTEEEFRAQKTKILGRE